MAKKLSRRLVPFGSLPIGAKFQNPNDLDETMIKVSSDKAAVWYDGELRAEVPFKADRMVLAHVPVQATGQEMRRREGLMGRAAYDDEVDSDTSFNFLAATVIAAGVGGLVYFFMKAPPAPATSATNLPVAH